RLVEKRAPDSRSRARGCAAVPRRADDDCRCLGANPRNARRRRFIAACGLSGARGPERPHHRSLRRRRNARHRCAGDRRRAGRRRQVMRALRIFHRSARPMSHMTAEPQRLRGFEKGRFETLVDGIFAVALTLLVLDIKLPENIAYPTDAALWLRLTSLERHFVIYPISFAVIAMYWISHHIQFHFVRYIARRLIWI